jgi:hypothetical protein
LIANKSVCGDVYVTYLFGAVNLKQNLENVAGKLCGILIPIKREYYIGGGSSIAIWPDIMHRILVARRLLSENKGLDKLITLH